MKIYKIEIVTGEKGKYKKEDLIDKDYDAYDEKLYLNLEDKKTKIDVYNKVQEEILKIFFPNSKKDENRNKR